MPHDNEAEFTIYCDYMSSGYAAFRAGSFVLARDMVQAAGEYKEAGISEQTRLSLFRALTVLIDGCVDKERDEAVLKRVYQGLRILDTARMDPAKSRIDPRLLDIFIDNALGYIKKHEVRESKHGTVDWDC